MLRWTLRLSFIIILQTCLISAKKSSLTFVIDDTRSMWDDIDQVRQAAGEIMNIVMREKASEIAEVVLVTFNDPDVVLKIKTSDKNELINALNNVVVNNEYNYDCPEYALTGIETALQESRPGSYLFVFTDATAKDHRRVNEIKTLCEKKQSQVVFVLTGDCRNPFSMGYKVYHDIAKASTGQVFRVSKNDVKDVLDTIKETVRGQKSVLTSVVVPANPFIYTPIPFTVDDKTEYVIISSSGQNVELFVTDRSIRGGSAMSFKKIMWKSTGKVVKFDAPSPGTYYAWVKGETDISIVVYARTDFTFDHGFSEFIPKSLADASKLPIADRQHHLSISVTDPDHTVDIKSAEILDMNERVIAQLPLKKANGDFYITDPFISPSSMFKIQVTGKVKRTGQYIRRISKTAIEPQVPPPPNPKAPEVTITEGSKLVVDYNSEVLLTCKVSGYPAPDIKWTSNDSTVLSSKSNVVEIPYDYISYLKLSNVKNRGTYYCRAQNKVSTKVAKIEIDTRSPFTVKTPSTTTPAKYGEELKLQCDISSLYPMDFKWNIPLKPLEFSLSADKKMLTIKSVDFAAQGKYTCEATLKSNPLQKHTVETNVVISDLAPPTINPATPNKITVSQGENIHIWCKIAGGVPRPSISWQVMKHGDNVYRDLPASGEELTIDSARLEDAGQYRCIATNREGQADKITNVIVQLKPVVVIEEGPKKSVAYDSSNVLTCKIVAYPLPKIAWKDGRGNVLRSKDIIINNEITSRLNLPNVKVPDTYSCFAENILGKAVSNIDVSVSSPFVIPIHHKATTPAEYGEELKLHCDISSLHPMDFKWNIPLKPSEFSLSADKKVLTIKSVDFAAQGKYTCEATLKSDPIQKHTVETNVVISDLAPPAINPATPNKITVSQGENIHIWCKIAGGVPRPNVSWQVMKNGDNVYRDLPASGEELTVDSARLEDAGQYRCIATNREGQADKITNVIVQLKPVVVIEEGSKKTVAYDSSNVLTCKIVAYPLPNIAWKDGKGNILRSQDIIINNEITSRLNLPNVKEPDTYSCFAENILGKALSNIDVSVSSPFVIPIHHKATTPAKYGEELKLQCDISSLHPLDFKWIIPLKPSEFSLSADRKVLTIKSIDFAAQGKYTCEATLKSDPLQKHTVETNVVISDLAPPAINPGTPDKITVSQGENIHIWCKIAGGVPRPSVSWQVMKHGDNVYRDLPASGEELTIDSARLEDAGQYRCIATNREGQADKITNVIVQLKPVVVIEEGPKKSVAYDSSNVLTCKIVAYPLPKIAWKDGRGNVLRSKDIIINNEITSRLNLPNVKVPDTYSCFAENILGKAVSNIDVSVSSPFVIPIHYKGTTSTSSKYGARTDITCDVKSAFPLKIRWFFKNKASAVSEIRSSDKYTVSASGSTLHILFTDLDRVGQYTCEASLLNDGNQKVDFSTDVQIDNLSPPVLQNTEPKIITVQNKDKVKITCKLLGGIPPPVVNWQVMRKDDKTFRDLFASGQELTLGSAGLVDAGQYRCIAKNAQGQAEKTTELIVQQAPEVSIDEGASVTVPYGSTNAFKCRIVAFPLPKTVSFQDNKGNDLIVQNIVKSNYEVTSQFKVQNIKASDKYSCYAENALGNSVNSIQVTVLPAIHFGRNHPGTTSVKYADPTNINCDAKSSFPLRIKWFYQKNELSKKSVIHTSDKYVISPDERTLHITSTDLNLVGKYTCEASLVNDENEKKSFTTKVEINNLKAPEIMESDKTITVMTGQKMTVVCKADGIPKPDVSWEFKSTASEAFTTIPAKGERITNPKISYKEAGSYKCTATSAAGAQSRIIDVVVHGEPKITNIYSAYYGVTGDKVLKIPCNVTGVPEPTITWKHDDKVITSDAKILVGKNALFIKNPTEKDSSNFTCAAKNKYGYASKKFEATVSDFIDYDEDLNSTINLKPGDSAKIECLLPHSDPQSVRWYVNGVKQDVLGTFYLLENVNFSNDANYTCRVNTEHGSESRNYVVDVGFKPRFAAPPSATIIWNGDKQDLLDCTVRAKPREKIEWFYNGKQLDGKVSQLAISGWGTYTCKVSNVHGSVQHTFNVTSDECLINRTTARIQNTPLLIGDEPSTWPRFETKYDEFLPIPQNEIITLECSTQDQPTNTFKTHPKTNRINAVCYNEDKFIVNGKIYKFEDLQCKEYVRSAHIHTKKPCMQSGQIIEVGFKLNNGFLGVYEVCYSEADHKTLYTKVVMSDVNIGNIVGPSFKLNEGIKTSKGSGDVTRCQYNRRGLVSPVDVAFGPAQLAALSDKYNAVPVYEPCEGSSRLSWSGVENAVESTLYGINTLPVWTGVSHYNSYGIPRYLWKVAKFNDDTFEAIVYVNAPNPSSSDILCPNTTPEKFTDITDANDKYTYACSIEDFMNTFKVPMTDFDMIF